MLTQFGRKIATLYKLQIDEIERIELHELAIDGYRANHVLVHILHQSLADYLQHSQGRIERVDDDIFNVVLKLLLDLILLFLILEPVVDCYILESDQFALLLVEVDEGSADDEVKILV